MLCAVYAQWDTIPSTRKMKRKLWMNLTFSGKTYFLNTQRSLHWQVLKADRLDDAGNPCGDRLRVLMVLILSGCDCRHKVA